MDNKKSFIINVLYYVLIIGLVYLFCNYLLGIFMPFILGFLFAFIAIKIAKNLMKKDTKLIRVISLTLLYIVIIGIISLLVILGINELIDFFRSIPSLYRTYVEPVLENLSNNLDDVNNNLPIEIKTELNDIIDNLLDSINSIVSSISSYIVSVGTSAISNTTTIAVALLTTIITSYFVVVDYEKILAYLKSLLGEKGKRTYNEISNFFVNTVLKVIKSYGLIMCLTFIELLVGLMLIGVSNFGLVSLITACLDILPVLGVGTVLIPWGIFELIVGNTLTGVLLLVLYVIITIVRNIVEPRIVGGNLGLHPLAALFTMIVGVKVFGGIGLFGAPLVTSYFVTRKEFKEAE